MHAYLSLEGNAGQVLGLGLGALGPAETAVTFVVVLLFFLKLLRIQVILPQYYSD